MQTQINKTSKENILLHIKKMNERLYDIEEYFAKTIICRVQHYTSHPRSTVSAFLDGKKAKCADQ